MKVNLLNPRYARLVNSVLTGFEKLVGFLVPSWRTERRNDTDSLQKDLLARAASTLLCNASFLVEPIFRIRLLKILRGWSETREQSFQSSHRQILDVISRRNWFGRLLIPSNSIAMALQSFGFFSGSLELDRGGDALLVSPRSLTLLSSILLRNPGGLGHEVVRDMIKTVRGSSDPMSPSTLTYIGIKAPLNSEGEHPVTQWDKSAVTLIIGPGRWTESEITQPFSNSMVLVTPNKPLPQLRQQLARYGGSAVLNNETSSLLASSSEGKDLRSALALAEELIVGPNFVKSLANLMPMPVRSYHGNFLNLWSIGAPSLLPRAISACLLEGHYPLIVGADLYTSNEIYDKRMPENSSASLRGDGAEQFFTCAALAGHDAILNFSLLKRLMGSELILGGSTIRSVLNHSLREYAVRLDFSLGERRR